MAALALRAETPATYQDLMSLPDHVVGEILCGVLHVSPRPASAHALASSGLGIEIGSPFMRGRGGPGGWWILDEPELHLGDEVMVPDLAGWRRERMAQVPEVPYFTLAPDWICEVLSPSTARVDRIVKMSLYARHGVSHAWLVDPLARTLEVYRRHEDAWLFLGGFSDDQKVRAEPFDAAEICLGDLWAGPAAP